MEKETNTYPVSDLLIDIYKQFNVCDQRDRMLQLSEKEKYFLFICVVDNHDEEDPIVLQNLSGFSDEIVDDTLSFQETEETKNLFLLEISKETDSAYIDTTKSNIPTPFTKDEVRELKLNNILEK